MGKRGMGLAIISFFMLSCGISFADPTMIQCNVNVTKTFLPGEVVGNAQGLATILNVTGTFSAKLTDKKKENYFPASGKITFKKIEGDVLTRKLTLSSTNNETNLNVVTRTDYLDWMTDNLACAGDDCGKGEWTADVTKSLDPQSKKTVIKVVLMPYGQAQLGIKFTSDPGSGSAICR